jgi:hypothetical protein
MALKIYSSSHLWEVSLLRDLLAQSDIEASIMNESQSFFGDGTVSQVLPELWIHNDADFSAAMDIKNAWIFDRVKPE